MKKNQRVQNNCGDPTKGAGCRLYILPFMIKNFMRRNRRKRINSRSARKLVS